MAWVMMTHRSGYFFFVGIPEPRICTCTFLFARRFRFSFKHGFGAEHRLPLGRGSYFPHLACDLPVHFAFPRALPSWPFRGRLYFAERGRLRWEMVDVHRAHWSLERGSVTSASRATLRDGLRGSGKQLVQYLYGGPVPPDGRRSDYVGLVPPHSRRRTSLLPTHPLPALGQTLSPIQIPPNLPPPAKKLSPSHSPLYPAQMHLPADPAPSAHAVPIPAPPKRYPGSPVKTCSGRLSWVTASNTRVAPPPP